MATTRSVPEPAAEGDGVLAAGGDVGGGEIGGRGPIEGPTEALEPVTELVATRRQLGSEGLDVLGPGVEGHRYGELEGAGVT